MCCEWVSAMVAGRGTSAQSKCIVTYKCNIQNKNPARESVRCIGIGVQGEGSNVNSCKRGERDHMSLEG